MAYQLMYPPIRQVVYVTSYTYQIDVLIQSGLLQMPLYPLNEIAKLTEDLAKLTQQANAMMASPNAFTVAKTVDSAVKVLGMNASNEYVTMEQTKTPTDNGLEGMSAKERRAEMKSRRQEAMRKSREANAKRLKEVAQRHFDEMKKRFVTQYEDGVKAYKDTVANLVSLYTNGSAKDALDDIMDEIDYNFDSVVNLTKSLVQHVVMMIAKIPQPGAIGMCVTNPGYAICTMVTDLKTIFSIILQILAKIKIIIKLFKKLYPYGDIFKQLSALLGGFHDINKDLGNIYADINNSTKESKKTIASSKTPCYECKFNVTTNKWEEDNLGGKIIGYKKPSKINVEETEIEDPITGQSFSIVTSMSIESYDIYSDAECNDFVANSVDGLYLPEGAEKQSPNSASVELSSDGKRSILHLANGKKIVIDKVVKRGDLVKLNNGQIISVQ